MTGCRILFVLSQAVPCHSLNVYFEDQSKKFQNVKLGENMISSSVSLLKDTGGKVSKAIDKKNENVCQVKQSDISEAQVEPVT